MSVIHTLFVTKYRKDGSHSPMTLTEWASQFLVDIECLFGPRDRTFTLLGIDIDRTAQGRPHLWFPDSGIPVGDPDQRSRHIVIRLGLGALNESVRARWQLAHECVHLLDPWCETIDGRPTNFLEEGLATWYQNSEVPKAVCHEGLYAIAERLVTPLISELPEAVKHIREERKMRIGEITPEVLCAFCPNIDSGTSRKLCDRFVESVSWLRQFH